MKTAKFTEGQIAFVLKQAEAYFWAAQRPAKG